VRSTVKGLPIRVLMKFLPLIFILFISCTPGGQKRPPGIISEVGSSGITSLDLSYKMAIERAYGNNSITGASALVALINDTIEKEVAKICRITIKPDEIAALSRHSDENSKAPEILAGVKSVFGKDRSSYERIFLAPKILNRKLHSAFSADPNIHKNERGLIEKAHQMVLSGTSMEEAAKLCGVSFSTIDYSTNDKEIPPALRVYFPNASNPSDDPVIGILETLSEGEIYRYIVEDEYRFMIMKLLKKEGEYYTLDLISVKKRPFMKWFLEKAERLRIKILDVSLEKSVIADHQNVWWVKKLRRE